MATTEPGAQFQFDQPVERAQTDAALIRNLFNALARSNFTTDAANPTAPREGMVRFNASDPNNVKLEFWQGGAWRVVLQNIQGGVAATSKQLVQVTVPATTWVVNHNLGNYAVALVFDVGFRQLRAANKFERIPLFIGSVNLATIVPGAPLRLGVPVPFDGTIRRSWAFPPPPGVLGAPSGTLDLDIAGAPVTGGGIPLGPAPAAIRIDGAPITAANAVVKGADNINLTVNPGAAAGGAGDALDVWVELEKTLQEDEYFLDQPTENRIVVTHPVAKQGWVVLIG